MAEVADELGFRVQTRHYKVNIVSPRLNVSVYMFSPRLDVSVYMFCKKTTNFSSQTKEKRIVQFPLSPSTFWLAWGRSSLYVYTCWSGKIRGGELLTIVCAIFSFPLFYTVRCGRRFWGWRYDGHIVQNVSQFCRLDTFADEVGGTHCRQVRADGGGHWGNWGFHHSLRFLWPTGSGQNTRHKKFVNYASGENFPCPCGTVVSQFVSSSILGTSSFLTYSVKITTFEEGNPINDTHNRKLWTERNTAFEICYFLFCCFLGL